MGFIKAAETIAHTILIVFVPVSSVKLLQRVNTLTKQCPHKNRIHLINPLTGPISHDGDQPFDMNTALYVS